MSVSEIFSAIAAHKRKGIRIHQAMMEAYDFLALRGYSKCQEYHWLSESKEYVELCHYYMDHYYELLKVEENNEALDIIPSSWYKHVQQDVDGTTRRNAIRDMMQKWVAWETETRQFLSEKHTELSLSGEIFAADYIRENILEVDKELKNASQKLLELETCNYDLVEIVDQQKPYFHKYSKKIKGR